MNEEDFTKDPYKKQTYETYALWKSLPSFLKGQPRVALEKFGVEEEAVFELLTIKTGHLQAFLYIQQQIET